MVSMFSARMFHFELSITDFNFHLLAHLRYAGDNLAVLFARDDRVTTRQHRVGAQGFEAPLQTIDMRGLQLYAME